MMGASGGGSVLDVRTCAYMYKHTGMPYPPCKLVIFQKSEAHWLFELRSVRTSKSTLGCLTPPYLVHPRTSKKKHTGLPLPPHAFDVMNSTKKFWIDILMT